MQTETSATAMRLRDWKAARGFSWTWLATRSGITYPRILYAGKGRGCLSSDEISRIAAALGIRPEQIAHTAPSGSTTPEHEHPEAVDRRVKERRQTLPTEGGTR